MEEKKLGIILDAIAAELDRKSLEIYMLKSENECLKRELAEAKGNV